ncbi:MAG: DUF3802 family protein [Psychrosphaera sp.]|nr:DUF3802 family protein [Psychrosphaera sp.]
MVTNKAGYEHLIEYLTDNLVLFEQKGQPSPCGRTVMELIEEHIVNHIMNICMQHQELEPNHRSIIVREVDGIVYDLEEILSGVLERPVTVDQEAFIGEFAGLIKNLFDSAIIELLD